MIVSPIENISKNNELLIKLTKDSNKENLSKELWDQLISFNCSLAIIIALEKTKIRQQPVDPEINCPFCQKKFFGSIDYRNHMEDEWREKSNDFCLVIERIYKNTNPKKDAY